MSGFTKGPWGFEIDGAGVFTHADVVTDRTHGYGCRNNFVCDLNDGEYHQYESASEQMANAHLIAAAPDMYEALKKMISAKETVIRDAGFSPGISDRFKIIEAALAKAEGAQ